MGPRLIRQNDGPFSAKGPGLEQASRDYLAKDYGAVVAYAPALGTGPLDPALPLRFQGQGIAPSKLPVGQLGLAQGGEWDPAWETKLAQTPAYRGAVVFLINPPRS
ncbi:hypothetical protein [Aeromonas popoffii]|uniref:hypothetical protein n=1 Tax=Aeromonas popoffii TaxID=70856 RepID=UPI0030D6024B